MKKKFLSLAVAIGLLATAAIGGTLAYFTDTEEASNTITMGDVSIWLAESQYHRGATGDSYLKMTGQPDEVTDDVIKTDSATYHDGYLAKAKLMPFDLKSEHRVQTLFEECTVAKNAYVMNTGNNDCFVRVSYKVPANIAEYLDIFYTDTQFVGTGKDIDAKTAELDARALNNEDGKEPIITDMKSSGANFVAQGATKDGDYYVAKFIYAERLTPGEMTLYSPISKITLVPTVTNEIAEQIAGADRQFDIVVEAEAIQADGFLNAVEAFKAFDGK